MPIVQSALCPGSRVGCCCKKIMPEHQYQIDFILNYKIYGLYFTKKSEEKPYKYEQYKYNEACFRTVKTQIVTLFSLKIKHPLLYFNCCNKKTKIFLCLFTL